MSKLEQNAHRMVSNLTEEMAAEVYQELAKDNVWFADNPDQKAFVKVCAPTLRAEARQLLAAMLARNDLYESDKHRIYQALQLDSLIPQVGLFEMPPAGTA